MMACPRGDTIVDFFEGRLSDVERQQVEEHLDGCSTCRRVFAGFAVLTNQESFSGAGESQDDNVELVRGSRVGRYVVSEWIGAGGMGVVYAAHDPDLDREVAIKLLRAHDPGDKRQRAGLLLEAQAMARLRHPNVVGVYDVGTHGGRVFVAMEYIRGQTLRQWLAQGRHGTAEVLEVMVAAGKGLAAAHQAGLVHRDYKPDNVLIGADGRTYVTDFGLATHESAAEDTHTGAGLSATAIHQVAGTPRYMAPEQRRDGTCTAASDQYSFCLVAYDALFGDAAGEASPGLAKRGDSGASTTDGRSRRFGAPVAACIAQALRRGMAADVAQRWPSMDALLDTIEQGPRRRQRRRRIAAASVAVLGFCGLGVDLWATRMAQRCSGASEQLAGIWDPQRRSEVETAFAGAHLSYGEQAWQSTSKQLDQIASDWMAMYRDNCEATQIRGEQPEAIMALRMACLRRVKSDLAAVATTFAAADAQAIGRSDAVVAGVSPVQRCEDIDALAAKEVLPASVDPEAVARVEDLLSQVDAEIDAGHYSQARQHLDAAKAIMPEIRYDTLAAEVAYRDGTLWRLQGDAHAAETALVEALQTAGRAHDWETMQSSASQLIFVVGAMLHRTDEALRYQAVAAGLAGGNPLREANWRLTTVAAGERRGVIADDERSLREVLEIYQSMPSPPVRHVSSAQHNLAVKLYEQGRYQEAEALARAAVEARMQAFGREHPSVAEVRPVLAGILTSQGRFGESELEIRAALDAQIRALGERHPKVASSRAALAHLLLTAERLDEASRVAREGLASAREFLGPEDTRVAELQTLLGTALRGQGQFLAAQDQFQAALATYERALGPADPNSEHARVLWAATLVDVGRSSDAIREIRGILAASEARLGTLNKDVQVTRSGLIGVLLAHGSADEAVREARRWVDALDAAGEGDQGSIVPALEDLGDATAAVGDPVAARDQLQRALAVAERVFGRDHLRLWRVRIKLAEVLEQAQQSGEAQTQYEMALTLAQRVWGSKSIAVARTQTLAARNLLAMNHGSEAIVRVRAAWAILERSEAWPAERGQAAFVLARALATSDLPDAMRYAQLAQASYAQAGAREAKRQREVEEWLQVRASTAR